MPSAPTVSPRRAVLPVLVDYLLAYLGFFSLMPVLPLLLRAAHPTIGALYVGVTLFLFSFAYKGGSLFVTRLLGRTTVRRSMVAGLLVAAAGFLVMSLSPGLAGTVVCLIVAGLGVSVNALMARVYVAVALTEPSARNSAFAAIHVILNVSGALGPIIANLLVGYGWSQGLLVAIALGYLVSAAVVAWTVPADLHPAGGGERRVTTGVFRTMVRDPAVRRLSVITAAGGFLYAQFFSALSIHITQISDSPAVRASFFTANAILVVVLQIPASAYTNRGLKNGTPPTRYLLTGIALFALAFGLLAGAADFVVVGTYLAVALFSLAETFFTPLVNTAYADVSADLPAVEAFTMRQIAATAGESLGAFAGGTLFLEATERGIQPAYWLFVALIGAGVIVLHRREMRRPSLGEWSAPSTP